MIKNAMPLDFFHLFLENNTAKLDLNLATVPYYPPFLVQLAICDYPAVRGKNIPSVSNTDGTF